MPKSKKCPPPPRKPAKKVIHSKLEDPQYSTFSAFLLDEMFSKKGKKAVTIVVEEKDEPKISELEMSFHEPPIEVKPEPEAEKENPLSQPMEGVIEEEEHPLAEAGTKVISRKRRVRLCDSCHENEVSAKKLRTHKWTAENTASFAKCQKTRRLKQSFETAKKKYAQLSVELVISSNDESSKVEVEKSLAEARAAVETCKAELEEWQAELEKGRKAKQAAKSGGEEVSSSDDDVSVGAAASAISVPDEVTA